jgi:hypothetical protein
MILIGTSVGHPIEVFVSYVAMQRPSVSAFYPLGAGN